MAPTRTDPLLPVDLKPVAFKPKSIPVQFSANTADLIKALGDLDAALKPYYSYLHDLIIRKNGFGEPLSKEENGVYNLLLDVLSAEDGDEEDSESTL